MNYLAHMYLSCTDECLLIGNFLADIISMKESRLLPDMYDSGFELHRQIDGYTDQHLEVKRVVALLRHRHHKYAPVISDVLFDYYLAKNWSSYSDIDIREFSNNVYHILSNHLHNVPIIYQDLVERMIKGDFLMNYSSKDGLAWTFNKMQQKAKFTSNFVEALQDIDDFDDEFDDAFNKFFPDLITHVKGYCEC